MSKGIGEDRMAQPAQTVEPAVMQMAHAAEIGNDYYQEPPNDLTGGLPINLDSLRDGPPGTKPFYPYSTLIRCVDRPNVVLVYEGD